MPRTIWRPSWVPMLRATLLAIASTTVWRAAAAAERRRPCCRRRRAAADPDRGGALLRGLGVRLGDLRSALRFSTS